jgi:hypothetical protein
MLFGKAIDDGEVVDAEKLARAETYSYTTRGSSAPQRSTPAATPTRLYQANVPQAVLKELELIQAVQPQRTLEWLDDVEGLAYKILPSASNYLIDKGLWFDLGR